MVTAESRFGVRSEEIAYKTLDGETIIINLVNGVYYSLPGVGSEAWELIASGRSLAEIGAILGARYRIPSEVVAADLVRLGEQLVTEHLVDPDSGSDTVAELPPPPPVEHAYQAPALQAYRDMADLLALDPPTPGIVFRPGLAGSTDAPIG
ncbi:MAG TPA: PqqD family protein [Gemmatimonadales bacterium]|nr:PqqD family protein [Gemmatimonadales bacterium]